MHISSVHAWCIYVHVVPEIVDDVEELLYLGRVVLLEPVSHRVDISYCLLRHSWLLPSIGR